MKKNQLSKEWLSYLVKKDHISKGLLALSFASIAFTATMMQTTNMIAISIGLLLFTVVFSFLSFSTLGRYRQKRAEKLYDAIRYDCNWPSEYNGRELNRINIKWKFLKVSEVIINFDTNSNMATNRNTWRNAKMSVNDSFSLTHSGLVTIFDRQGRGQLTFISIPTDETSQEAIMLIAKEEFTSFIYDGISNSGKPLPMLTAEMDKEDVTRLNSATITTVETANKYERKTFEEKFRRQYEDSTVIYSIIWDNNTLNIKAIKRDTPEYNLHYGTKSLISLVKESLRTAFYLVNSDEYVMTADMITWGQNSTTLENFTVDLTHVNVSGDGHVERFEKLTRQGLYQLFKVREWDFNWDISAHEKTLTVTVGQTMEISSDPSQNLHHESMVPAMVDTDDSIVSTVDDETMDELVEVIAVEVKPIETKPVSHNSSNSIPTDTIKPMAPIVAPAIVPETSMILPVEDVIENNEISDRKNTDTQGKVPSPSAMAVPPMRSSMLPQRPVRPTFKG